MKKDELDLLIKHGFLQSEPDKQLLQQELGSLVSQGFLEELSNHFFSFDNNLTWEIVYETLLYAERRRLHDIVARHIEKHNEENLSAVADMLLYHYEKSNDFKKCVFYGCLAGDKAASLYANDDAINYYQRALHSLKSLNKTKLIEEMLIHEHMGGVYHTFGKYQQAIDSYSRALDLWNRAPASSKSFLTPWSYKPSVQKSSLYQKLATSHEQLNNLGEAQDCIRIAEETLPTRPGNMLAKIYSVRSLVFIRKGNYNEALDYGIKALRKSRALKNDRDTAYAHNMIAGTYNVTGKFREAITHLEKAANIYEIHQDYSGLATTNYNLGNCLGYLGKIDQAIERFKKVLEVDKTIHNNQSLAMDYFNIGNHLMLKGDMSKAISNLELVIGLHKKGFCRDDLAGLSLLLLSTAWRTLDKLDSANNYIEDAIKILSKIDDSPYLSNAKLELAELRLAQGRYDEAVTITDSVIKSSVDIGAKQVEVYARRINALALDGLNELEAALNNINQAIDIANSIELTHEIANCILTKTKILFSNGQYTVEMVEDLNKAITIFKDSGAKLDLEEAESLLQQVNNALRNS